MDGKTGGTRHASLADFIKAAPGLLAKGAAALVIVEDEVETDTCLRHHVDLGFTDVCAFMPAAMGLPEDVSARVHRIDHDTLHPDAATEVVNAVAAALPGKWLYYCYNAEFLFFPFCETRTVGEMLAFHTEERRDAMLTYVVDLYAGDLWKYPTAVSLSDAHLDKSGYYALAREGGNERQLDFFGGLRWRYEEHVPKVRRRIDRIALFRAQPGVRLQHDHTFTDQEYNTYACPWHHNLTAAIVSFRTAKALKSNPGSTFDIQTFKWHNSAPFEWHSRQLLDLGLMEPGQWF